MTYVFYMTPGHGYLRVPRIHAEGFVPTQYSMYNREYLFLEEDCDAPAFMKWAAVDQGDIKVVQVNDLPAAPSLRYCRPGNATTTYDLQEAL